MKHNYFIKEDNCKENKRSKKVAIVVLVAGLLLGVSLIAVGVYQNFRAEDKYYLIDYYMYGSLAIAASVVIAGDIYMTPKSWSMVNAFYKRHK